MFVIYKNNFDWGVAEFGKNKYGDYNNHNEYLIVYGDGKNIDFSRVDIGINNNYIPINIPEEEFVAIIKINQYSDDSSYRFNYKYHDVYGNIVKEY